MQPLAPSNQALLQHWLATASSNKHVHGNLQSSRMITRGKPVRIPLGRSPSPRSPPSSSIPRSASWSPVGLEDLHPIACDRSSHQSSLAGSYTAGCQTPLSAIPEMTEEERVESQPLFEDDVDRASPRKKAKCEGPAPSVFFGRRAAPASIKPGTFEARQWLAKEQRHICDMQLNARVIKRKMIDIEEWPMRR